MNKNIGIIIGLIALLGIGWYAMSQSNNSATSVVQNPTGDTTVVQTTTNPPRAGLPVVVGDKTAIPTDTTVVVTGKVTPNGAFTSYWYEYGTTPSMGGKTANQLLGSGSMALNAASYITGLVKDTTYYFRLNAKNEFGQVSDGQFSFTTTHGYAAPVGSVPTVRTNKVSGITQSSAYLDGEVTPNKGITQFWFEYGTTANLGNTTALVSVGDGAIGLQESQLLTNLTPATTYYYRINAQNQFGTVNGATLNFKTAPLAIGVSEVKTMPASGISQSAATLNGVVNPKGSQVSYWFMYGVDSLLGGVLVNTTAEQRADQVTKDIAVAVDVTGLSSKTTYYFQLVGRNDQQGGVKGEIRTFKTK